MSRHAQCCLAGICCPPRQQRAELAKEIAEAFGWSDHKDKKGTSNARAVADWLLDHFDLVPRGVGQAIADGYRPFFKERLPKEAP